MSDSALPSTSARISRQTAAPIAAVIVAMISIEVGATFAKRMFGAVGPVGASSLRLAFASLILLMICRPWRGRLTGREIKAVLAYGLAMGGMNLCYYCALKTLPLGLTAGIEFAGPLCLSAFTSHRRLDLVWVATAGLGIVLLLGLGGLGGARIDPLGVGFALGGALGWAAYIWFGQKVGVSLRSDRALALGALVAAGVVLPIGLAQKGPSLFQPALIPVAITVAILSSALPYGLEMAALKRLPTRTFGVLMSLDPAFAALAGLGLLGERLSAWQDLGLACVIAASLGAAATARPAPPAALIVET